MRSTVKYGSQGVDVRELQTILIGLGYEVGSIDGVAGSMTVTAIREFQLDNNLTVDGIAGSQTWEKLDQLNPVQMTTQQVVTNQSSTTSNSSNVAIKSNATMYWRLLILSLVLAPLLYFYSKTKKKKRK